MEKGEQAVSIKPMYRFSTPSNPGKLLFTCQAQHSSQGQATLSLYEKCMIETISKKKQVMEFDFDLRYEFTLSPPSLTFQKDLDVMLRKEDKKTQKTKFFLQSAADLNSCRNILKNIINQKGFHEQFKPKKKIGKGNFASVYLAEKLETGKNYAVKAFSKEAAYAEDKGKECLIKEIQIMRALDNKYCMKLQQVFESDNSLYIVVELLQGGQLYDKVKAKYRFKQHQTKYIVYSILQGLKQMHSKNAMHRDLKPENLIFRKKGSWQCVIADFGLAEFADADEYLFVRCGTPGYVAPQVINIKNLKSKYHPICDMFSLGLIFHVLLLNKSAFPATTYNLVLAENRACSFDFSTSQYKNLNAQTLDLLVKMLQKSPQKRISAIQALKHPYFASIEQTDELEDTVQELQVIRSPKNSKAYPSCESPLLTSADPARRQDRMIKKDSCVDFKMGKDNVFTGRMDTIVDTGMTNNSVGKTFESVQMPKASAFRAKKG